ncbi:MAG: SDR family NAD(P)-dependent oxidoreductase [Oliverpabstia sp.]
MAKKAIVTGGGRGIGAGITLKLAEEGYDLVISYATRPDAAEKIAKTVREKYGRECHVFKAVLEEEGAAESFIHTAIKTLGGVDLFVNNAIRPGLGGGLLDIDTEEMDKLMRADLRGMILCTRETARYMVKHEVKGAIVLITSMRAERAMPNAGLYSGFKAGTNQMMKCFALDLASFNIRINAVEPGAITVRTDEELLASGMDEEHVRAKREFAERIPLGRKGVPNDIAEAVAFLASEKASYITGATLLVDGGLTLPGFPESLGESGTTAYSWGYIKKPSEWKWVDQY